MRREKKVSAVYGFCVLMNQTKAKQKRKQAAEPMEEKIQFDKQSKSMSIWIRKRRKKNVSMSFICPIFIFHFAIECARFVEQDERKK